MDTGFASYRYQVWSRWPMTGPTDFFGSAAAHDRHCQMLSATKVPLDAGMIYFDARLCEEHSNLEVRVADVRLDSTHAAVLAAMVRALVETTARSWAAGMPVAPTPTSALLVWSWQGNCHGVDSDLVNPMASTPSPAAEVVAGLLDVIRPVLLECGEETMVTEVVTELLNGGSGDRRQRAAYADRQQLNDVVSMALGVPRRYGAVKYAGW